MSLHRCCFITLSFVLLGSLNLLLCLCLWLCLNLVYFFFYLFILVVILFLIIWIIFFILLIILRLITKNRIILKTFILIIILRLTTKTRINTAWIILFIILCWMLYVLSLWLLKYWNYFLFCILRNGDERIARNILIHSTWCVFIPRLTNLWEVSIN